MLDQETVARRGKLLLVDYRTYVDEMEVIGIFRVEKDFIPYDALQNYLNEHPSNRGGNYFDESSFVAYLVTHGYMREIAYDNFYLGGFGNADRAEYHLDQTWTADSD